MAPKRSRQAFIATSLPVDDRRAFEGRILEDYRSHLLALGVTGHTLAQLKRECVLALLSALAGMVTWLGSSDLTRVEERQRAMIDAIVDEPRLFLAVLDHVGSELPR